MATKLKDLKVTKVDFVDVGANPKAHIKLYKNESGTAGEPKGETGQKHESVLKKCIFRLCSTESFAIDKLDSTIQEKWVYYC